MQQKTILGAIVVIVLIVGGFAVWKLNISNTSTPITSGISNTPTLVDEQTALAHLQADMKGITPHFITHNEGRGAATLTSEEQKIRDDLVALYAARYAAQLPTDHAQAALTEAQNGVWLNAIGKRYLLVTEANTKSARDQVLDTQTGAVTLIPGGLRFYFAPERDIALFIDSQVISTYSLDQATATTVTGSQLTGTQTYHSGYTEGAGVDFDPRYTKTKSSITITVYDSSKMVSNPGVSGAQMYTKVGQKTFSF